VAVALKNDAMARDEAAVRGRQIVELMRGFSIETTPGSALKIPDYRAYLRPGTTVAVTFLPGSDFADTVRTARRLRDEGFEPAPHFAARSIPSLRDFELYLKRLRDEVGVRQVVALGGAMDHPVGPFDSSMQLLETGLFDKYGIETIGLAGHPEGSPDISEKALAEALAWKNAFAERSDAACYLATQFCFEAGPIIAWDRAIRAAGNRLPIHIGMPGLASRPVHARAHPPGPEHRQADDRAGAGSPDHGAGPLSGERPGLRHPQGARLSPGRSAPLGQMDLWGGGRRLHREAGRQGLHRQSRDRLKMAGLRGSAMKRRLGTSRTGARSEDVRVHTPLRHPESSRITRAPAVTRPHPGEPPA
jgi:methylenetetrahydrofolate reductase (NADPH)